MSSKDEVLDIVPPYGPRRFSQKMRVAAKAMNGFRGFAGSLRNLGQSVEVPKGYPTNPDEAKTYIRRVGKWMIVEQERLNRWARALDKQVTWGVAKCAELKRFNNHSLGFFYHEMRLFQIFRRLGAQLEAPPRPLVFADNAQTFVEGVDEYRIVTSVDCDAQGYVTNARAMQVPPPNIGPTTGEDREKINGLQLRGIGSLGVLPAIVVYGAVFVASALAAGTAVYLTAWGVSKVIGVFTGDEYTRLEAAQRDKEREQDAARAEFQNRCYEKKLATSAKAGTAVTLEESRKLFEECVTQSERVISKRDQTLPKGDNILKIGVIGGIIIGSLYFLPKVIESFSSKKSE